MLDTKGDKFVDTADVDKRYEDLANAIVLKAVEDYRAARAALAVDKHNGHARGQVQSIRKFFRSTWFGTLTTVDPEYLIGKLDGEAKW